MVFAELLNNVIKDIKECKESSFVIKCVVFRIAVNSNNKVTRATGLPASWWRGVIE